MSTQDRVAASGDVSAVPLQLGRSQHCSTSCSQQALPKASVPVSWMPFDGSVTRCPRNASFTSHISDDGRWFVVACGVPDPLFRNRVRITPRGALAINGPALRLEGHEDHGDEMLDRALEVAESRGTDQLYCDLVGSYAIGSISQREGMVALSSHDGMYPVYYTVGEGYCAVSNRATTLAKLTDAAPNTRAMAWLVATGNVFGPETAFRGVDKVEPGEFVAARLGQGPWRENNSQRRSGPIRIEPPLKRI